MEEKSCSTCVHEKGKKCKILKEKISCGCFAWADEEEAIKREQAVEKYSGAYGGTELSKNILPKEQIERRQKNRKLNLEKREGKSIKEVLDERFYFWYLQGKTDAEIGKILSIDPRHIWEYRKDLEKKTALLQQKRPQLLKLTNSN